MMKKLNFFGVGPKIGRILLPYLAVSIVLTVFFPGIFNFGASAKPILMIIGIILVALGAVLYGITVRSLLKGLKETRLMTTGAYRFCQNPLYAVIILMIVPGIALAMNSWLILTAPILGYLIFKKFIRKEYAEMTEVFGEEYLEYKKRTPEFFPFTL